jgi:hypothetical protein
MATLYVIPNWEKDFETPRSRETVNATFFCVGNSFDGRRIRRLQKLDNPLPLYGAFHVICALASKCSYRGVLLDDQGPLKATDIAEKSGFDDDVALFKEALDQLSEPMIQLLEKHEIEQADDGTWPLPAAVARWAVSAEDRRRFRSAARGNTRTHEPPNAARGQLRTHADARGRTEPPSKERPTADARGRTQPHAACTEQNRTEQKVPPTVPQGGQLEESLDFEAAKQFFHGLFGRSRAWSYEEDQLLHALGSIRRSDAELLRIWFSLPAEHPVFEKTKRKHNLLTLLREFNAELDKARAHENLFRHKKNGAAKKEPPRWRDFFKWQYGPDIRLELTFEELDQDQKDEYERGFQTFVEAMAQLENAEASA